MWRILSLQLVLFLFFFGFSRVPAAVEWWARGPSPIFNQILGGITGIVQISLAEAGGVTLLFSAILWLSYDLLQRRQAAEVGDRWTTLRPLLFHRLLQTFVVAGFAGLFFYGGWGLNYAREPLRARLGWDDPGETSVEELSDLGQQLAILSNRSYREATGSEDLGAASELPMSLLELHDALEAAFVNVTDRFHLEPAVAVRRAPPKPVAAHWWMVQVGLLGFYSPFTGEANILTTAPAQQLPQSIAHEKSHQRGIGPEDEANFMGFLVSASCTAPYARYSAYLFAWKQVFYEISRHDEAAAQALVAQIAPGPLRDMKEAWKFWHANEGVLRDIGRTVNDTYLKANGQIGVQAYNQSVRQIIAWTRVNRGKVSLQESP